MLCLLSTKPPRQLPLGLIRLVLNIPIQLVHRRPHLGGGVVPDLVDAADALL